MASSVAASSFALSSDKEEEVSAASPSPSSGSKDRFTLLAGEGSVHNLSASAVPPPLLAAVELMPTGLPPPPTRDRSSWERSELRVNTCPPSKPVLAVVLVGS